MVSERELVERFLAVVPDAVLENPVTVSATQSNDGWLVTFALADYKITKIEWRKVGEEHFRDTGVMATMNSQTGRPMPNMSVSMGKLEPGQYNLEVRYVDIANKTHGPFKVSFDTEAATLASSKQLLGSIISSWIFLREYNGMLHCHFTTLLGHRSSLKAIHYSVDSEALDKTFPFNPAKPGRSPYEIDAEEVTYLDLPLSTRSVSVQLEYRDGTKSEVKTFSERTK